MGDNTDSEQENETITLESYKPGLIECMKLTAEIHGVSNLSEDILEELYEGSIFILKLIIQQSIKFMDKNSHHKLTTEDIRLGMKSRGIQPVYGYVSEEPVAFKHARAGGKEFFFVEDKEIDLNEFVNMPLPKVPLECSIKAYCLAINGTPPSMKEKNSAAAIQEQSSSSTSQLQNPRSIGNTNPRIVRKYSEKAMIKEPVPHELSLEQQHYFIEITDACICPDESKRLEALESLRIDTGLAVMLPRFCRFISLGVKASAAQNNLALLIYLMRMCKALIDNSSQSLQPYLDEIVPPILTCITCRQLCLRPDVDNHRALRDFAASLLCQVCRSYNTNVNRLQLRVCNFLSSLLKDESAPLATQYGAIYCLGELGPDSITNIILPNITKVSQKISSILDNSVEMLCVSNIDKNAADAIKVVLLKILPSVIKQIRKPPDSLEDYQNDYGTFLGPLLYEAVLKSRQASLTVQGGGLMSASPVIVRGPIMPMGTPRTPQNASSQLIRVSSNPRNTSLGSTLMPSGTRQNVVLIAPQQRFQTSANNVQVPSVAGTTHLLRLIPAGSSSGNPNHSSIDQ